MYFLLHLMIMIALNAIHWSFKVEISFRFLYSHKLINHDVNKSEPYSYLYGSKRNV